jgi:hypothetical protein
MLSNRTLAGELEDLAASAAALAKKVAADEDLPPRLLAGGVVAAVKLAEGLSKLTLRVTSGDGNSDSKPRRRQR